MFQATDVSQMFSTDVLIAFGLTLFAGLSTGIGSAIAFFSKTTNTRFLAVALGFSAGVMIYVSLVEIFFKAKDTLVAEHGLVQGNWITLLSFFGGILFIGIIDRLVPSASNPHEIRTVEDVKEDIETWEEEQERLEKGKNLSAGLPGNTEATGKSAVTTRAAGGSVEENDAAADHKNRKLMRMGLFTALAIAIHNFPEGLATFIAALTDLSLGIPIAIAIAIHNIPEGIAVSVPIYYATGSRRRAFKYSFLSGLAEPVGALIGWLILMPYLTDTVFGIVFAGVAGIMVFISFDELLPAAREYGEHHLSVYGLIAGMAVMGISLVLLI
jgi:zinc transporter, ZIP family